MLRAITRAVSPAIQSCELTHLDREPIDLDEAIRQHDAYVRTLEQLGCAVERLPALAEYPDSVFVEDTALVFDELAVLMRPGATSRQGEVDEIEPALAPHRELARIEAPATIDGGDVVVLGKRVFVGLSTRSNQAAIDQLAKLLEPFGYSVEGAAVRDCLHLKSAATAIADDALVVNPAWLEPDAFGGVERVEIDPEESGAANAVRVGSRLVVAAEFPRTAERLTAKGYDVHPVPAAELAKAEGAVTCCSLVFDA